MLLAIKSHVYNAPIIGSYYAKNVRPQWDASILLWSNYRSSVKEEPLTSTSHASLCRTEREVSSSETQAKPFLLPLIKSISSLSSEALLYRWIESPLPGESGLSSVLCCLVHLGRKEVAGHRFEGKRILALGDKMITYSGLALRFYCLVQRNHEANIL